MKARRIAALSSALALTAGLGVAHAGSSAVAPPNPGLIAFVDTSTGVNEIAVMRADGSQRHLLTRSLPLLGNPAVSPDGKTVAVTFGNHSIALVAANGSSLRQITSARTYDDAPTWSRDGRLAYLRLSFATVTTAIIVADSHGRHQHVLAREPALRGSEWLAWSRNGRDVLYGPISKPDTLNRNGRYLSMDARTRRSSVIVPPRACNGAEPLERPGHPGDVACATGSGDGSLSLWLLHDGHRVRRLAREHVTDGNELTDPAWSPDGSAIAFTADASHVAVARLRDGGTVRTYAVGSLGQNGAGDLHPSWSLDGRSLVVGMLNGGWAIVRVDLASGGVRVIVRHAEADTPRWSPDGTTLAYLEHVGTGATELVTRPLQGSASVLATLAPLAGDGSFTWSPDSRSIAFVSPDGALDVASPPSGAARTLVASGVAGGLAWSRDGATIAYVVPGTDGHPAIRLIQADGTPTLSLPTPLIGIDPTWLADGRLLYLDGGGTGYDAQNFPITLLGATAAQTSHFPLYARDLAVSPVDSRFLISQESGDSKGVAFQLSVIGPDGANASQSTFVADARGPGTWSPDGEAIAYPMATGVHGVLGIAVASSANLFYPAPAMIATDATDPSWGPAGTTS